MHTVHAKTPPPPLAMPGQGHHRLLFVLTVLWCHLPVMRTEQYVYDQIEKPKTPKFEQCHMFILASIYTCYASAASTYNIDETEVLHKWPSRPSECCAVWNARDCIKVKMVRVLCFLLSISVILFTNCAPVYQSTEYLRRLPRPSGAGLPSGN